MFRRRCGASSSTQAADQLANGELLAAGQFHDQRVAALGSFNILLGGQVCGQLAVQGGKVFRGQAQCLGQLLPGVLGLDEFVELALKLQASASVEPITGDDARQDLDAFRVTAHGCGTCLEV